MALVTTSGRLLGLGVAALILSACTGEIEPGSSSSETVVVSSSSLTIEPSSSSESSSEVSVSSAQSSEASSAIVVSSSSVVSSIAPSSSSIASSSSETTASSSPTSGDFSGTPNLSNGKVLYELGSMGCVLCHGDDGQSTGIAPRTIYPVLANLNTQQSMAQYLHTTMPDGNAASCQDECARDIAAYILNGLKVNTIDGDHELVSEAERAARVAKGKEFMDTLTCRTCHGSDDDFLTCPITGCNSWEALRDYISANMPQGSGGANDPDGVGPTSCEGDCADRAADYVWNQANGWALTTKNGSDSGQKTVVENRTGQDVMRLKTYDMLMDDFARIFGDSPAVLAGSKPAFKPEPDFWHTEGELGAVALNVVVNAAIESCGTLSLPALNESALSTSCADWARKMWLRDATAEELQSCINVALIDTTDISDANTRAKYACVSMMTSLPALTF